MSAGGLADAEEKLILYTCTVQSKCKNHSLKNPLKLLRVSMFLKIVHMCTHTHIHTLHNAFVYIVSTNVELWSITFHLSLHIICT